jgi:hypothetical protein
VIVLSKPSSFAEVSMASLARSVFTVSHHLAKESPRNDGRMKDASKETLVRLHQTLEYQSPDPFERKQKMPLVA